jgi:hypothetical protein
VFFLYGQLLRESYGISALKERLTEQLRDVERLLSLELHEEEQAAREREHARRVRRETLRLKQVSQTESSKVVVVVGCLLFCCFVVGGCLTAFCEQGVVRRHVFRADGHRCAVCADRHCVWIESRQVAILFFCLFVDFFCFLRSLPRDAAWMYCMVGAAVVSAVFVAVFLGIYFQSRVKYVYKKQE